MIIHHNFADFVLFLYLHMAHADGEFHIQEQSVVLDKMIKLYPEGTDFQKIFDNALSQYNQTKKEDINVIIKDTFQHFSSIKFSTKYKVYTDMYDIINADGKIDESETHALEELKDIINLSHG